MPAHSTTHWIATFRLNAVRIASAGVTMFLLYISGRLVGLVGGPPMGADILGVLVLPPVFLLIGLASILLLRVLGSIGGPIGALTAWMMSMAMSLLMVVFVAVGDPLIWIVRRFYSPIIPDVKFWIVNPYAVIIVDKADIIPATPAHREADSAPSAIASAPTALSQPFGEASAGPELPPGSQPRHSRPLSVARPAVPPTAAVGVPETVDGAEPRLLSERRPRRIATLVFVASIVVVLGSGLAYYSVSGNATWSRSRAVPPEVSGMVQRGVTLAAQGHYDKAVTEFSQAIVAAPWDGIAYSNRGVAYMQLRAYAKALDDLRKASEINPRDVMAHYNVAAIYAMQGERQLALDSLARALENGFTDVDALRTDPDFAKLRTETGFGTLINRFHKR